MFFIQCVHDNKILILVVGNDLLNDFFLVTLMLVFCADGSVGVTHRTMCQQALKMLKKNC